MPKLEAFSESIASKSTSVSVVIPKKPKADKIDENVEPVINSHSSKVSFDKTTKFAKDIETIMDIDTDELLNDSQYISQLDNLVHLVNPKKGPQMAPQPADDMNTDDVFDQLTLGTCAYIHESLQSLDLPIRHESTLSIIECVVIPYSENSNKYLLEMMLAMVNKCGLIQYKPGSAFDLNEQIKLNPKLKSLENTLVVYEQRNNLLTYIVEALGGIVLDHYPHFKLTEKYEIIQMHTLQDAKQLLNK